MRRITLDIPENKYSFFVELIHQLGLETVQTDVNEGDAEALAGLEQSLREVKLIQEGRMKGTPLKELLNEL